MLSLARLGSRPAPALRSAKSPRPSAAVRFPSGSRRPAFAERTGPGPLPSLARGRWLRQGLSAVLLIAAGACRPAKDPAIAAVDALVEAANKRDRSAIVQRLTPDFQAADGSNATDVDQRLRQVFAGYDGLDVALSGLTIEHGNEVALARFRLDLTGTPSRLGGLESFLPRSSRYKFELRLVPAGGPWKVAWASWEEEGR